MKITRLFKDFFDSEKAGGIILIACTIFSLALANSAWSTSYTQIWQTPVNGHHVSHWINDGLMTIFFLLIGLELEREVYYGELSSFKDAALPIAGAVGGMVAPAFCYLLLNYGTATQSGLGISMATDIAFALGILSLLGSRVPVALKIFLTALAVIDDLGAILIIAFFYTGTISWLNLSVALGIFVLLLVLNRLKVHNLIPYLIGGVAMWYFMLLSGVHATITGVLTAFAIPFGDGSKKSPSYILQHLLHKPVAFIILPLFALANTAILISGGWQQLLHQRYSWGIALGLLAGKPAGIFLFSYAAVKLGWCRLPADLNWKNIFGAGLLGGIGFTMSVFITLLAFDNPAIINNSKLVILISSFIAGVVGYFYLKTTLTNEFEEQLKEDD